MPDADTFFDTNILLYLLSADTARADRVEELLANGDVISVQVLNEFAAVASRKLAMSWGEIREFLDPIRPICMIEPVTVETMIALSNWRSDICSRSTMRQLWHRR